MINRHSFKNCFSVIDGKCGNCGLNHWDTAPWDIMMEKHFPHYWPFVTVTARFFTQRTSYTELWRFFDIILNKMLNKQSKYRWFETPWRSRGVIVMQWQWEGVPDTGATMSSHTFLKRRSMLLDTNTENDMTAIATPHIENTSHVPNETHQVCFISLHIFSHCGDWVPMRSWWNEVIDSLNFIYHRKDYFWQISIHSKLTCLCLASFGWAPTKQIVASLYYMWGT